MARGKAFPHCSFLSTSDVSTSSYQTRVNYNDKYCPDGETVPSKVNSSSRGKYGYCNTIELKINPEYSADEEHQIQKFYYQKY